MKKVIWAILIILIIAAIGVGGWFLWDSLQKEKNKTAELENRLVMIVQTILVAKITKLVVIMMKLVEI